MALLGQGSGNLPTINKSACTPDDFARNAQLQYVFNEYVSNFFGEDAYKVAVDATDFTDGNWDYLYPKCYNQLAFDDELHQPVYAEVIDDGGVRKVNFFTMITGEGGVSDTYKFKASTSDTDPDFFIESMVYTDTYASGTDIPVYAAAEDAGGGAESIRLYTRVDATFFSLFTDNLTEQFFDDFYTNANINYVGLYYDDSTHTFALGYTAIRGLVKGAVTADDTQFVIDNVVPLGNGRDPVNGNAATEVAVANIQKEALADNAPVTCIFNEEVLTDVDWELLVVERFRAIRGQATATATTGATSSFNIDAIVVLDSGRDPRTDPTSAAETVSIYAVDSISLVDNDNVWADYNAVNNRWEARPPGGGSSSSGNRWARVLAGGIDRATGNEDTNWGDGDVNYLDTDGSEIDDPIEVNNLWPMSFPVDAMVLVDTSFSPPRVVTGTCLAFPSWAS